MNRAKIPQQQLHVCHTFHNELMHDIFRDVKFSDLNLRMNIENTKAKLDRKTQGYVVVSLVYAGCNSDLADWLHSFISVAICPTG